MADTSIFKAFAVVKSDMTVLSADSNYHLLVNNVILPPLYEMVIPDDIANVKNAMKNCNPTSSVIVRIMASGRCKNCIMYFSKETKSTFNLVVYDCLLLQDNFEKLSLHNQEMKAILRHLDIENYSYDKKTKMFKVTNYGKTANLQILAPKFFSSYLKKMYRLVDDEKTILSSFSEDKENETRDSQFKIEDSRDVLKLTKDIIYDSFGRPIEYVGVINERQSKVETNDEDQALDPLTKLLNKGAFNEIVNYKIDVLKEPNTLFIMDVDNFKDINDNYGHIFGDKVLVDVSSVVKNAVDPEIGFVGRFGGDEFVVLASVTTEEDIRAIAKKIRMGIQFLYVNKGLDIDLTISIGIATFPINADNYMDLFKIADKSLYIAKNRGKNRYIIYDEAKHGSINYEKEGQVNVAINSKKENEFLIHAEVFRQCINRDSNWLEETTKKIRNEYCINRIYIYKASNDFHSIFVDGIGFENTISDGRYIINPSYLKEFDGKVLAVDNTVCFEGKNKEAHHNLFDREIKSFIQFLCKDKDGNIIGAVSFEECFVPKTWKKIEINFLCVFAQFVEDAMNNNEI